MSYQAILTADRAAGIDQLKADANGFVERLMRADAGGCAELTSFVSGIRASLAEMCPPCAIRLLQAFSPQDGELA